MVGTIVLTSKAAYQVGCGTVTAMIPNSIMEVIHYKLTEAMAIGAPDVEGHFSKKAAVLLKEQLHPYDVVAIDPGMGREKEHLNLVVDALYFIPEVLDLLKVQWTIY